MTTVQLRRYSLPADTAEQDRWVEWWRTLRPAREQYGFTILFGYVDRAAAEFVWAVSHDGDFDAAEAAYMASPERATLFDVDKPAIQIAHVAKVDVAF